MANEKRLIDANAFWNRLNNTVYDLFDPESDFGYSPGIIKIVLDQTKTVDAVEVVHGYWYEHHGITICSHCQAMFDTDLTMLQVPSTWNMPNYCPNCGAKMDGGNENG